MVWVLLVLAYGIIKGLREVLKKKALERNSVIEVLFLYTFLSFILVLPEARQAGEVEPGLLLFVALKSFAIFLAWLCGFKALAGMQVSLYGVIDLSRVVFSTLLGVIVLDERPGVSGVIGLVLVLTGLTMLKFRPRAAAAVNAGDGALPDTGSRSSYNRRMSADARFVILALISCMLNALSGLSDKLLMSYTSITDGQLQFWYMLFLVVFYMIYIAVRKPVINWRSAASNRWVWLLAVLFVIADRCLFIANADPTSRVTVMTLIKQSGVLITIVCGKLVFREKNITYRLICALIVLAGIAVSVLF